MLFTQQKAFRDEIIVQALFVVHYIFISLKDFVK